QIRMGISEDELRHRSRERYMLFFIKRRAVRVVRVRRHDRRRQSCRQERRDKESHFPASCFGSFECSVVLMGFLSELRPPGGIYFLGSWDCCKSQSYGSTSGLSVASHSSENLIGS